MDRSSSRPGCRGRARILVLAAALAHGVWKGSPAGVPAQGHRLDLHEHAPVVAFQQQVGAAALAILDLAADAAIRLETRHLARGKGLAGHPVGQCRVDAGHPVPGLHQLPGVRVLARLCLAGGQPDPGTGVGAAGHRPRVGAVGGDHLPALQFHVRQEPLVPPPQYSRHQLVKPHARAPATPLSCQRRPSF